jgi:hypothetical protein
VVPLYTRIGYGSTRTRVVPDRTTIPRSNSTINATSIFGFLVGQPVLFGSSRAEMIYLLENHNAQVHVIDHRSEKEVRRAHGLQRTMFLVSATNRCRKGAQEPSPDEFSLAQNEREVGIFGARRRYRSPVNPGPTRPSFRPAGRKSKRIVPRGYPYRVRTGQLGYDHGVLLDLIAVQPSVGYERSFRCLIVIL